MDRLNAISVFTQVVETGSFSEAGRRTGRSPASVSRLIRDLEEWIGGRLFYRTTRKITLTEIGASYYDKVKGVLLDLEEARVSAAKLEDYPNGAIRLTAAASMENHITHAVAAFQERWPAVDFCISLSDTTVDIVKEGFDMAVRIGRLQDSTLKARKIGEAKRYVCASPSYLEKSGTPARPEDLEHHSCLVFRTSPGYNVWAFKRARQVIDVKASGRFCANSGPALLRAACMGLGVILMPEWLVGPALKSGKLVPLLEKHTLFHTTTPLYAVHAYQRFVPPKVRVFTDFLADRFGKIHDWRESFSE